MAFQFIREPENWITVAALSLLGGCVQNGMLTKTEALLSTLAMTGIRVSWLMRDHLWWSETLSGQVQGFSDRLSFMERREMYRYFQGHELVRQLRNWFYEYDRTVSEPPWFFSKLASEVSLWRQACSVRRFALSAAVFSEA